MPEPTATRIYIVERNLDEADVSEEQQEQPRPRLVRASHPSPALRHVAQDLFSVRVATQEDLVQALKRNVQIEQTGEQL